MILQEKYDGICAQALNAVITSRIVRIIEKNRFIAYSCTNASWGSATDSNTRVRSYHFSLLILQAAQSIS